jgi:hypothetical protein
VLAFVFLKPKRGLPERGLEVMIRVWEKGNSCPSCEYETSESTKGLGFFYGLYKPPLLIELYLILNNPALRTDVLWLQVNIVVGNSPTTHGGLPSIFPFTLTTFAIIIRRLGGLLSCGFMTTKTYGM